MSFLAAAASRAVVLQGRRLLDLPPLEDASFLHPSDEEPRTLYLHIPFCLEPCPFCAFHRFRYAEAAAGAYYRLLGDEAALYGERGFRVGELYLGGGTPTVAPGGLALLLDRLRRIFGNALVSVETNPLDLTAETVGLLVSAGVNRLSVGVQSFDDALLRAMGRGGLAGRDIALRLALAANRFDTLQIDLLYNHPRQTEAGLCRDIRRVVELGVEQVTFNPLMPPLVRGDEPFAPLEPDEGRAERFYRLIVEELGAAGYEPMTVWCFGKRPGLLGEYFGANHEYLAAGCGAAGFFADTFYLNSFDIERYSRMVAAGRLPVALGGRLSRAEVDCYRLLADLFRLKADGPRENEPRTDRSLRWRFLAGLTRLSGLTRGSRVTRRGMPVVSRMMRAFFGVMTELRRRCLAEGV